MPHSAPKPCRFAGCRALARDGVLCDAHKHEASGYDSRRRSSTMRGYGRPWSRLRRCFLSQHPLCSHCLAAGHLVPATQVDHIVPLSRGGGNDTENLEALCARHHSIKTVQRDGGFGRQRQ